MIESIWEITVKPGNRGQFELVYGPGGAWSKLYARSPGFRGLTLLHDTQNPRRYLTIEVWDSLDQREKTLFGKQAEYAELVSTINEWIESRIELGVFSVMAEGAVRPRSQTHRAKPGKARRKSH